MRAPIALGVYALILANSGYSQPGRGNQAPRDELSRSGVIPDAPGTSSRAVSRASSPVVSLGELRHTVPAKAQREIQAARKACGKQQLACVEHLKKAVELDPEYVEARQELGRAYVRLDQPENVIETFEGVLKLDPRSADAYSFIGAAKASLEQYADAEAAARQALRIVPTHLRARFVLGMSLAAQRKNDGEALQCLAETSETYPGSHIFTAHVLARRGETAQARRHLETYLAVAPASEQAIVKDWLLRLEPQAEVTAAR